MSNIHVKCPFCQTDLETDDSLVGVEVGCAVCGKSFTINAPAPAVKNIVPQIKVPVSPVAEPKNRIAPGNMVPREKLPWLFAGLLALSLLLSSISICWLCLMTKTPRLEFEKEPEKALRAFLAANLEMKSNWSYFWRKNSGTILRSLEVKEVKQSGNYAIVFYRMSMGATEEKCAVWLHKNDEGYWTLSSSRQAQEDCPESWYREMSEKERLFIRDSGKFNEDGI